MEILNTFLEFLNTPESAGLGPEPRLGVRSESDLVRDLDTAGGWQDLAPDRQELIRALLLLWHDHLDAGHTIAQRIGSADGAFVHGIMHRREPDYGNATYWFRRVGAHPSFPEMARLAAPLSDSPEWRATGLGTRGIWDPFAFISACEQVHQGGGSPAQEKLLRRLQRIETEVLLRRFCGHDL
jgi:hypothetical protein